MVKLHLNVGKSTKKIKIKTNLVKFYVSIGKGTPKSKKQINTLGKNAR